MKVGNIEKKDIKIKNLNEKSELKKEIELEVFEFNSTVFLECEEDLDEKTIQFIEREIRNSYEYRNYINYLKNELDLTKCSLLKEIDIKEIQVSLEFHHFPFNLFEITKIVGRKKIKELKENKSLSCIEIAEEVTKEHYKNNIGLVPLTKTIHEMAHNNSIMIPLEKINGNYKNFIQKYNRFIEPELLEKVNNILLTNNKFSVDEFNKGKLKKEILNYSIQYNEK